MVDEEILILMLLVFVFVVVLVLVLSSSCKDSDAFDGIIGEDDDLMVEVLWFVVAPVTFLEAASRSNWAGDSAKFDWRMMTSPYRLFFNSSNSISVNL